MFERRCHALEGMHRNGLPASVDGRWTAAADDFYSCSQVLDALRKIGKHLRVNLVGTRNDVHHASRQKRLFGNAKPWSRFGAHRLVRNQDARRFAIIDLQVALKEIKEHFGRCFRAHGVRLLSGVRGRC